MYRFVAREESSFPVTVRKASRRPSAPSPLNSAVQAAPELPIVPVATAKPLQVESLAPVTEPESVNQGTSNATSERQVDAAQATDPTPVDVPINVEECSGGKCSAAPRDVSMDEKKRLEEFLPPKNNGNNKTKGFKR